MYHQSNATQRGAKIKFKNRRKNTMKKIITLFKALWNGTALNNAIENGLVSFEGQGRNKYGK